MLGVQTDVGDAVHGEIVHLEPRTGPESSGECGPQCASTGPLPDLTGVRCAIR